MRKQSLSIAIAILLPLIALAPSAHAVPNTFQKCDVFTGVGGGQINWYRPNACPGIPSAVTFQGTLQATGFFDTYMTGMSFDVNGGCATTGKPCLYATTFNANTAAVFDVTGAYLGTCGGLGNLNTAGNGDVESAVVVPGYSGGPSVFFGQADGDRHILRYPLPCTPTSTLQNSYAVSTGPRGTDWIDMSADLCNMHYTSEGVLVRSFNVCTSTQNPDFATALPGSAAFAHRILSDGSELVGDASYVVHVSSAGANINTCVSSAAEGGGILFSMDILPDQKAFAVAPVGGSNQVSYQTVAACDAGTATSAFSFTGIQSGQTGCGACVIGGTAIFGEFTVSSPQGMHVSKFFTRGEDITSLLPLDSKGNPKVDVVSPGGVVKSTNPGEVRAWVNVTNTDGPLQSLKLNDTLPVDWTVDPPWMPAKGAMHVFVANTTGPSGLQEITDPSTITVSTTNPEVVHVAIPDFNSTALGHPLLKSQSVLLSVKLSYGLKGTSQPASSYPRNYTDVATATGWTKPLYTGTTVGPSTGTAFFTAYAKLLGDVNGDNKVDIRDVALVAYSFNSRPGSPSWNLNADFDGDGVVDIGDVATVALNFGTSQ